MNMYYTYIALSDQIIFIFGENQFIRLRSIATPHILHLKRYSPLLQLNITSYVFVYMNIQKKEKRKNTRSFFTILSLRSILFKSQ